MIKYKNQWISPHSLGIFALVFGVMGAGSSACLLGASWSDLHPEIHHLGVANFPEWDVFENRTPEGRELSVSLGGLHADGVSTLLVYQDDVKESWELRLNGHRLGKLFTIEQAQVTPFAVQPEWIQDDVNTLSVHAPKAIDDIEIGAIRWSPEPQDRALHDATIRVEIREEGVKIPCRLTVADERGALFPVHPLPDQLLAVRPGVIYTGDGHARFGLPEGTYTLYASRGFEYGVDRQTLKVVKGIDLNIQMNLRREVDTRGWIAADTHIHTRTYSGHGDAGINEGMLSIAGEGIELAVATDHNHHTDYTQPAEKMGVNRHFTSVIGNEVTTKTGHFNAFPILPGSPLPDHSRTNWVALMDSMRQTPGVKVIILNHPRNIHNEFCPMDAELFDVETGAHRFANAFTFDGIELVTSAALQNDMMRNYRDWFALLNRGHRLVGVGSSDTHDISRYILGQGRSYIRCEDADSSSISIEEACHAFLDGRVLVSMGLWVNMRVEDRFEVGDTATDLPESFKVEVRVQGPSWVVADEVSLYLNGERIRHQSIEPNLHRIEKSRVQWAIPRPDKPAYLVAIAQGPGVEEPFWVIPRPYQHKTIDYTPRIIGSTNPIWIE